MTQDEALKWLAALSARRVPGFAGDRTGFTGWALEAEGLFVRVFVPSEPVLQRYQAAVERYVCGEKDMLQSVQSVIGAFEACKSTLENAPSADLFWEVRVADSEEVLEQAEAILSVGFGVAAAAVLAGGALEQHLLHLCQRYSIPWAGSGSISAYNNAVRSVRAKQAVPYQEADAKQVDAWGAIRNEAAHAPGDFKRDQAEVTRMIDGVRSFLVRAK